MNFLMKNEIKVIHEEKPKDIDKYKKLILQNKLIISKRFDGKDENGKTFDEKIAKSGKQEHTYELSTALSDFYSSSESTNNDDEERFSDFSIKCSDGEVVKSEKYILNVFSAFFRNMFALDGTVSEATLDQFDSKIVKAIVGSLTYFQIEKGDFTIKELMQMIVAADFLGIPDLLSMLAIHINVKEITEDEAFELLQISEKVNSEILANGCFQYFWQQIEKLDHKKFVDFPKETLKKIFADNIFEGIGSMDKIRINHIHHENELVKKLYNVLKEKGCLEDFEDFINDGFNKDHLYFLATKDTTIGMV